MEKYSEFWYLLLLHHSQTRSSGAVIDECVWYLLLLHHSQTLSPVSHKVGLVWFLLLLHHSQTGYYIPPAYLRLVPFAFTSFSNPFHLVALSVAVWFLLLLHHSQTYTYKYRFLYMFGSFCFYIILKLIAYCLH